MKTTFNYFVKLAVLFLMFASTSFSQSKLLPPGDITFGLGSTGCFKLQDPSGTDYFSMCLPFGQTNILGRLYLNDAEIYKGTESFLSSDALQRNTFLGINCGASSAYLTDNTAVGVNALGFVYLLNEDVIGNTAIGSGSLGLNWEGEYNTAVGLNSSLGNIDGNYNTAVGYFSLGINEDGDFNTAVGYNSGSNIRLGSNNITIGYDAQVPDGTASNQVRIGNTAITQANIQVCWTVCSDRKLKSNIFDTNLGLNFISKIRPVSYTRNNDEKQKTEFGFIAQEVEEVLKESGIDNSGMITIDDDGGYSMRYNDLLSPMVKAIQELKAENEELKKEVTQLKTDNERITKLEQMVNELTSVKHTSLNGKEVNLTNSK